MPSVRSLPSACAAALLIFALSACGDNAAAKDSDAAAPSAGGSAVASNPSVAWTQKKVDVQMITDSRGERYDPTELSVVRGDSLRFVLQGGVHNVHFLPSKNPPGVKLPPMGEYLQLPGQATGYLIDFPEGRYYFQCDIHLALGMIGHVNVKGSE